MSLNDDLATLRAAVSTMYLGHPDDEAVTPRPDTDSLASLLAQATPGPWEAWETESHSDELGRWVFLGVDGAKARGSVPVVYEYENEVLESAPNVADARLIALAPDMARLLVDDRPVVEWAASVACLEPNEDGVSVCGGTCVTCAARALLARFAALDEKAGGA